MEQWSEIGPNVEPLAFHPADDGRILVEVHQVVRDRAGTLLANERVVHRFAFEQDLIQGMEVCSLPSANGFDDVKAKPRQPQCLTTMIPMHDLPNYTFSFNSNGRSGTITCSCSQQTLVLDCEMSGVPHSEMLMAPLDLRSWTSGQLLTREEQVKLLGALRDWLIAKRIRTDVDVPSPHTPSSKNCWWKGCFEPSLEGSAYCIAHYNLSLLR